MSEKELNFRFEFMLTFSILREEPLQQAETTKDSVNLIVHKKIWTTIQNKQTHSLRGRRKQGSSQDSDFPWTFIPSSLPH